MGRWGVITVYNDTPGAIPSITTGQLAHLAGAYLLLLAVVMENCEYIPLQHDSKPLLD